jgi:hypothetical protein
MPLENEAPAYDAAAFLNSHPPRVPILKACEIRQVSRTRLYELAGQGRVCFVKDGSNTLVDTASLIADLMNLPAADIQAPADRRTRRAVPQS